MGKYFKTSEDLIATFSAFYDLLRYDKIIGPKMAESGIVIRFEYTDPGAWCTINARDASADQGAYADFVWNDSEPEPEAVIRIKADIAHRFWHGRENPFVGVALGRMKIKGNTAKVLALLPAFEPAYRMYPRFLKKTGRGDIAL